MLACSPRFTSRPSGVVFEDLIAVSIDVGKHTAAALVSDFTGRELVKAFAFRLDRGGVAEFVSRVQAAVPKSAQLVRVGLEAAGHYHLPMAGPGVLPDGWELRILNPSHVAMQRKANGQRGVKTDKIDLVAIRDLLFSGAGHEASSAIDPVRELEAWAAHRRRRSLARRRTIQQLTTQVDRCFPGLGAVMWSVVLSQAGRLIITELPDPARVVRLGPTRLRAFAANRNVRMTRPLADKIVEAARQSLPVHGAEIARTILAADLRLLTDIERQIAQAETAIETVLPATPFDVLRTTPGWGPVRVGSYGAAVGEPSRWPSHRQLYRAAGLTPRLYESAGKRRDGAITREGSVPLRVALVDLGMGLWHQDPASKDDASSMRHRGKPGGIITIAMAHRANKIAYAMVRDQQPWDPNRWAT